MRKTEDKKMVNTLILKNKGFTEKEIGIITKHFRFLYTLYIPNESNIFQLLEYINAIQSDVCISYVNNWVFKFELLKTHKNITIDLLSSSL